MTGIFDLKNPLTLKLSTVTAVNFLPDFSLIRQDKTVHSVHSVMDPVDEMKWSEIVVLAFSRWRTAHTSIKKMLSNVKTISRCCNCFLFCLICMAHQSFWFNDFKDWKASSQVHQPLFLFFSFISASVCTLWAHSIK